MTALLGLYVLLVAGLVAAEFRASRTLQLVLKPLAALTFCLIAVMSGVFASTYGALILAALIFCAVGDVALLSRGSDALFKFGMAAFAIGHLVYTYAFFHLGFAPLWAAGALLVMGGVGLMTLRVLSPKMAPDMRLPVRIYVMIITAMVVTAFGTQHLLLIVAAVMFAISDIFVARDRFLSRDPRNALIISPLYFGAQALFALSVSSAFFG